VLLARAVAARAAGDADSPAVAVSLSGPVHAEFTVQGSAVRSGAPGDPPEATVAMPTLALYRWLSGEALDAPVAVHGSREAVTRVAAWAERAIEE
jgi:hypothetical protein